MGQPAGRASGLQGSLVEGLGRNPGVGFRVWGVGFGV